MLLIPANNFFLLKFFPDLLHCNRVKLYKYTDLYIFIILLLYHAYANFKFKNCGNILINILKKIKS